MNIQSSVCVVHKQDTIFDAVEFQQIYRRKPFALGDIFFKNFLPTCAVDISTILGRNETRKFDIKDFIPDASLYGVVGSSALFIRSLIGSTWKI